MADASTAVAARDIADLRRRLQSSEGSRFWKALDEAAETPAFRRWLEAELPEAAAAMTQAVSRRGVLQAMAASALLAGLPGCDVYPPEDAVPWVEQPERMVPGVPRFYATMIPFSGYARPLVAECHEGRPTRLDGNDRHPAATTALDPFAQAEVLRLYDPDRSRSAFEAGAPRDVASGRARLISTFDGLVGMDGVRLLTGRVTSPTLARQVALMKQRFPGLRRHVFEPTDDGSRARAMAAAFGPGRDARPRLDRADTVVSLEDDLLGPGPGQLVNAGGWARRRWAGRNGEPMSRLFVAESTPSLTGAMATHRLRIASARIPHLAAAIARAAGVSAPEPVLDETELRWAARMGERLRSAAGRGLFTVGPHQPAEIQMLACAVNDRLGVVGRTLTVHESAILPADGRLADLVEDMAAGRVRALLMIDVDPVFAAPAGMDFAAALGRVADSFHLGLYQDDTAKAAGWHLPLAHPLESWGDARAPDGTATLGQPVLRPLYGGQQLHGLLAALGGAGGVSARRAVRETWRTQIGEDFEEGWRRALHDGFVPGTAAPELRPGPVPLPDIALPEADGREVELVFRPDPHAWDGAYANIGWLQELPAPITKLTWDNAALVSPALAERLRLDNGRFMRVETQGGSVDIPAWIVPGQAENTVTLPFGQGRHAIGRVAAGAGVNVYPLRPVDAWYVAGARLTALDRHGALADTQMHGTMDGADAVRTVSPAEARRPPAAREPPPKHESIYGTQFDYQKEEGEDYAWAMSIDLDTCIGCNACVTACVAENNIMVVGRDEVRVGREMHWIRVDRYFEGGLDDPAIHFQPVPCMHCENAPCEVGCPVRATVHGPEGLNQMIYNRCIGTRTCSSYCPYKVRRFNWYDYSQPRAPGIAAQYNPDVTVRSRGVMEKCTYCVQRISAGRRAAKKEGRRIRDGEVRTACQTACPTQAIVFGDKRDRTSAVHAALREHRSYKLLEELNTRPRTAYRARVREDGEGEQG